MSETIFDKIVSGEIRSYKVWEDDNYLAFLTPFPNTPGFTVVIPKVNQGDYVFNLNGDQLQGLMEASRKVAKILEKAFKTPRVALVFEGTGVAYVHAKLIPLHGKLGAETNVWSEHHEFFPEYHGFLSTVEGPKMTDVELKRIQSVIVGAQI
jgi:histidine triad (HIT) family protein